MATLSGDGALFFFYHLTWDESKADDFTQETFLRLWLARKRWKPKGKFTTYLFQIAKNFWLNQVREQSHEPETVSLEEVVDEEGTESDTQIVTYATQPELVLWENYRRWRVRQAVKRVARTVSARLGALPLRRHEVSGDCESAGHSRRDGQVANERRRENAAAEAERPAMKEVCIMTCAQVRQELVAYLRSEISGERKEAIAAHLQTCENCRRERERLSHVLETLLEASSLEVIRKVDDLFREAIKSGASDIHFEPKPKGWRVRMRIDGVLHDKEIIPRKQGFAVIARLKELGDMDITQQRLPQEGLFRLEMFKRLFEVRLASLPVVGGERLTVRILPHPEATIRLDDFELSEHQRQQIDAMLTKAHGLIFVTGPVNSIAAPFAYALLRHIAEQHGQNASVFAIGALPETPLSTTYLPRVNHVMVNPKAGMTYANSLRAVLQQDPDVVMVGEVDNAETAKLCLKAALDGHLIIAVMEASDTIHALEQLQSMGVDNFALSASLIGSIALRWVRKICPNCAVPYESHPNVLKRLNITEEEAKKTELKRGAGCEQCRDTGYKGRALLIEMLTASPEFSNLLLSEAKPEELRQFAFPNGTGSLWDDAKQKVLAGITTPEEVLWALLTIKPPKTPLTVAK